jgi:hypothetical protein
MNALLWLLAAQGLLGALDVLVNHEWREDLPHRASAALEQAIHGWRELLYALVFAGLAWCEWHGAWAWVLGAVLLIEIGLTGWDFVEEDRTRVLSSTERLMHLVLSMGGGAYCAMLAPILAGWARLPSGLALVDHGIVGWLLTLMSGGVLIWGVRDLLAAGAIRAGGGGGAGTGGIITAVMEA